MNWEDFPESLGGHSEPSEGAVHTPKPQFAKTPAKLIHNTNITDGAVRLYGHMILRFGRNQKNFEGRKSMAEELDVSDRVITNRISELEAYGWVVVVERARTKEGEYRTPFYHLFLRVRDSVKFRKEYKPRDGEKIRDLPEKTERKSRKGKGGKPSHKNPPDTNGTQVPGVNLNASNSSSTNIDVDSTTYIENKMSGVPDGVPPKAKTTTQDTSWNDDWYNMMESVKVLPGVAGEVAIQYVHMLRGTSTKKSKYTTYKIPGGIWAYQFDKWVEDYKRQFPGAALPKEPDKLYGHITQWLEKQNGNGRGKPVPITDDTPTTNGDHIYDMVYYDPQDGSYIGKGKAAFEIYRQRGGA